MRTILVTAAIALMMTAPQAAAAPTQSVTIWGTSVFELSDVIDVGFSLCVEELPDTVVGCESGLANRGRGTFDVSGWSTSDGGRTVTIDARLTGLSADPVGGFMLLVCSDVNDNDACFSVDHDLRASTHSDDDGDASITVCVPEDDDGAYDDLDVFIGVWADSGAFSGSPDAGVSEGAYTVDLTPGAFVASCP